jgi:hypothetical protein
MWEGLNQRWLLVSLHFHFSAFAAVIGTFVTGRHVFWSKKIADASSC